MTFSIVGRCAKTGQLGVAIDADVASLQHCFGGFSRQGQEAERAATDHGIRLHVRLNGAQLQRHAR